MLSSSKIVHFSVIFFLFFITNIVDFVYEHEKLNNKIVIYFFVIFEMARINESEKSYKSIDFQADLVFFSLPCTFVCTSISIRIELIIAKTIQQQQKQTRYIHTKMKKANLKHHLNKIGCFAQILFELMVVLNHS